MDIFKELKVGVENLTKEKKLATIQKKQKKILETENVKTAIRKTINQQSRYSYRENY